MVGLRVGRVAGAGQCRQQLAHRLAAMGVDCLAGSARVSAGPAGLVRVCRAGVAGLWRGGGRAALAVGAGWRAAQWGPVWPAG